MVNSVHLDQPRFFFQESWKEVVDDSQKYGDISKKRHEVWLVSDCTVVDMRHLTSLFLTVPGGETCALYHDPVSDGTGL